MKQINTITLFLKLKDELLSLLMGLNHSEWNTPSPIHNRSIKDLVSHLIDTSLRRLSIQRDGYQSTSREVAITSYEDLVNYIQTLNREWMHATERLSPKILLDLYTYTEDQLYAFFTTLDPDREAIFPVQWAGDESSPNWFDIAREYTEKWHHQMQIRMALGKPLLMERGYTEPLYDAFMMGLPHHYRCLNTYPLDYIIQIRVSGNLNKSYWMKRADSGWILVDKHKETPQTRIEISEEDAWKIFTNTDRKKEKYIKMMSVEGDDEIGNWLTKFVAVLS